MRSAAGTFVMSSKLRAPRSLTHPHTCGARYAGWPQLASSSSNSANVRLKKLIFGPTGRATSSADAAATLGGGSAAARAAAGAAIGSGSAAGATLLDATEAAADADAAPGAYTGAVRRRMRSEAVPVALMPLSFATLCSSRYDSFENGDCVAALSARPRAKSRVLPCFRSGRGITKPVVIRKNIMIKILRMSDQGQGLLAERSPARKKSFRSLMSKTSSRRPSRL